MTTPDDPIIDPFLIEYVSTFVPKASGKHFSPHVTTGVAPREYLDQMLAEPFQTFTFSPTGAAVYQLASLISARYTLVLIERGRSLVRDRDQPYLHAITSIRTKP